MATNGKDIAAAVAAILGATPKGISTAISVPKNGNYSYDPKAAASSSSSSNSGSSGHQSVFHHILDYLSRGEAASAGAFREGFDPKNSSGGLGSDYSFSKAWHGFKEGAEGHTHNTFQDVLKDHGHTGGGMGTLGLALDVLADPTTYMGVGLVGKAGKAAGLASKGVHAIEGAEDVSKAAKVAKVLEAAKPAPVQGVQDLAKGIKFVAKKIGGAGKVADAAGVPVKATAKGQAALAALLAEHAAPAVSDARTAAKEAAPVAKAVTDALPFEPAAFVPKTFDEIKSGLTDDQKAEIFAESRRLAAPAFKKSRLAKLASEEGGFKDFSYKEIMDDPELRKSLQSHPEFRDAHAASLEAAKAKFLRKINDAAQVAHEAEQGKAAEQHALAQIAQPVHEGAAHAIMDAGPIEHVAQSTPTRVLSTGSALSEGERGLAELAAKNQLAAIRNNPLYEKSLTGAAQANLRNTIENKILQVTKGGIKAYKNNPEFAAATKARVDRIYAHAEALLESKGLKAVINPADKVPLRLSTMLPHLAPHELSAEYIPQLMEGVTGNPVHEALRNAAMATAHIDDAAKIHPVISQIVQDAQAARMSGSLAAQAKIVQSAMSDINSAVKETGASDVAKETGQTVIRQQIQELEHNPLVKARVEAAPANEAATVRNAVDPVASIKQAEAVDKWLGIRFGGTTSNLYIPILPATRLGKGAGRALNLQRGVDGLLEPRVDKNLGVLGRYTQKADRVFRTAFDNSLGMDPAMHQLRQQSFNASGSHIVDDINELSQMAQGVSKADFATAYGMAQAKDFSGPLADTAQQIHNFMDRIYGAEGYLRAGSGTPPEFVHGYLKRAFRGKSPLTTDIKDSAIGKPGKLENAYDSWRHVKVPAEMHPAQFMAKHANAAQRATGFKLLGDNALHTFGSLEPRPGYVQLEGAPGFFPSDIAPKLQKMLDTFHPVAKTNGPVLQQYDRMLRFLKTGFTKYMPSHHINNSIGQTLLAFNDGLTSPTWYTKAFHVLHGHASSLSPVADLTGEGLSGGKVVMRKFGQDITADQIWHMGTQAGIRQAHAATEGSLGEELSVGKSALRSVSQKVTNFSNDRENFHRYAHFMYALDQSKQPTLAAAIREAATRVNTIHGDYSDLTKFERSVAQRLIPFYTWQRKVGPIVFKQAITNPGRTMVYPKIMAQIGANNGMVTGNTAFPQPNELVPSYLQDLLQVKMGTSHGEGVYGGPRSPFGDVVGKYSNNPVGAAAEGMMIPKIAAETLTHNTFGTDSHPYSGSRASHLEDSLPYLSVLKRLTGRDPATGFTKTNRDDAQKHIALLNLLTAGSGQVNTPRAQKYAEREARK